MFSYSICCPSYTRAVLQAQVNTVTEHFWDNDNCTGTVSQQTEFELGTCTVFLDYMYTCGAAGSVGSTTIPSSTLDDNDNTGSVPQATAALVTLLLLALQCL